MGDDYIMFGKYESGEILYLRDIMLLCYLLLKTDFLTGPDRAISMIIAMMIRNQLCYISD